MEIRMYWVIPALLIVLSGCDKQIEDFVRGPGRDPAGGNSLIQVSHQKEFISGHQDVIPAGGYRVQATLGAPVDSIQSNSSGGYKLYHTVQGSISN